jgi:hypothetical protein
LNAQLDRDIITAPASIAAGAAEPRQITRLGETDMREGLLLSLVVLACSRADPRISREKADSGPAVGVGFKRVPRRSCESCDPTNIKAFVASAVLAATLQFSASNAQADKVWLENNSTTVKQLTVTLGYPNKESCLFKTSMLADNDGGVATFGFSLLQIAPLSPFSYADKAAQWSRNELIQLQVDGNKPIINQAHIDEYRSLSGLLIIPSAHLAEQMLRGRTLTVTTRAGARTFPIPTDAVKAFQQCANALAKRE